jgi:rubrerythrin
MILFTLVVSTQVFSQDGTSVQIVSTQGSGSADMLQAAYSNEANLRDRYLAYAGRADEEGYGQVASMFRAIARGEDVHAARLAALISPSAQVAMVTAAEAVIPMSTKENLQSALAQQIQERDAIYPRLLQRAQAEKNKPLLQTVRNNLAAEPAHLAWFRQAMEDLDGYKGENIDFYVCTQCGNTVRALRGPKCEICSASKDKFERVR